MTISTLLKYLIGDRDAILCIARCPKAIWVGLLLVLAAGFAREYDGEDLLHEPWHLLIPLGASLASSAVLYLLVRFVAWCRRAIQPGIRTGYLDFLTLYWMMAPLALVYAIPFERFLSGGDAMRANLWLLALVAAWRVLLMSRVIAVLYNADPAATFFVVMLFADSLLLAIVALTPLPILSFMGGVRLSESEEVLQVTTLVVGILGVYSWFVWFIVTVGVAAWRGSAWRFESSGYPAAMVISRSLWISSSTLAAIWLFVLPITQPEQLLRHQVERDLRANRIRDALTAMSAHEQSDFPPHWDPPPKITRPNAQPDITAVEELAQALDVKPWVRDIYDAKFVNSLQGFHFSAGIWEELSPDEIERRLKLLDHLQSRNEAVKKMAPSLSELRQRQDLPQQVREHVTLLLSDARVLPEETQQNEER